MKKFNLQILFCCHIIILLVFACYSCTKTNNVKRLSGETFEMDSGISVFFFLSTECPICRKYLGSFRLPEYNGLAKFYYVFCGDQDKKTIQEFINYDSISPFFVLLDRNFEQAVKLKAVVTPQVVITKRNEIVYNGSIDDRFQQLGSSISSESINYVRNALFSLSKNESIKVPVTRAVGCFIEPR